jgi:putative redox protein
MVRWGLPSGTVAVERRTTMSMEISFPGGLAVTARYQGFTIATDQPIAAGGRGSAPAPFDLFLAALGTCAGLYALRFCQQRGIDTTGLALTLATEHEGGAGRVAAVRLEIQLPAGFPEKYRDAIVRAADQCAVKRHILEPPRFEVVAVEAAQTAGVR